MRNTLGALVVGATAIAAVPMEAFALEVGDEITGGVVVDAQVSCLRFLRAELPESVSVTLGLNETDRTEWHDNEILVGRQAFLSTPGGGMMMLDVTCYVTPEFETTLLNYRITEAF